MKCSDLCNFLAEQQANLDVVIDGALIQSIDIVHNNKGKALYLNLSTNRPETFEDMENLNDLRR